LSSITIHLYFEYSTWHYMEDLIQFMNKRILNLDA